MYYETGVQQAGPDTSQVNWSPIQGFGQDAPTVPEDMEPPAASSGLFWIGFVGSWAGALGGAYHGYKRNKSVGWAIGWFFFGGILWPLAIPIALAQGFGKPKGA